jgi:hypothetical protein
MSICRCTKVAAHSKHGIKSVGSRKQEDDEEQDEHDIRTHKPWVTWQNALKKVEVIMSIVSSSIMRHVDAVAQWIEISGDTAGSRNWRQSSEYCH